MSVLISTWRKQRSTTSRPRLIIITAGGPVCQLSPYSSNSIRHLYTYLRIRRLMFSKAIFFTNVTNYSQTAALAGNLKRKKIVFSHFLQTATSTRQNKRLFVPVRTAASIQTWSSADDVKLSISATAARDDSLNTASTFPICVRYIFYVSILVYCQMWIPYFNKDIGVQRRAMQHLSYDNRLEKLRMSDRRARGDLGI